ncbi:5-oxoprolinase subunit PxpB [Nosocomiicoccus ampullae]|uniref:5-oxoprolinase subunit PxpB n=1 Tax=Nosocomiicoccus ampullae TaxID=489910 RepID=UPI00254E94DB|nr:5-oxoprolinase subunit PxpB [Nosocomiicoccus ampullae]MDK6862796.1 5-oxoprolinase subunit PxpB [Nosocomiicoccus ampullae]
MDVKQFSEDSLTIYLGDTVDVETNQKLMILKSIIESWNFHGIYEIVPSYTSLTIHYNLLETDVTKLKEKLGEVDTALLDISELSYKVVEIPVCYGGDYGPDVERFVTDEFTEDDLIHLHAGREYHIFMLGFMPGFPFLGGLDEKLYKERLDNPRTKIPGGSVGIGGEQTGVYPFDSPGGWNIIGRTPVPLYDNNRSEPILYEAGDRIVFRSISEEEYDTIVEAYNNGVYKAKVTKRGSNNDN